MLEGFDEDWNYIGSRRHITFTNLNSGKYTLRIRGTNNDGIWNEIEKSLKIYITPPFWQTWWFYSLCGLILLSIVFIVFRVRLRQVRLEARKEYFKRQNHEKITLLKEIHHRVKNNLQVVNSLLRLQSHEIEDKKVVAMFEEAQNRVLSMALLHEKMYQSSDLQHIDIQEHFTILINELIKDYEVGMDISADILIENVDMGIKTLVPLGLIINEMITNSLKYAFKDKDEGIIIVHLKHLKGKRHELIIGDNGIGMSNKKREDSKSLGSELIEIFTEQLNGSKERLDQQGTVFKIAFETIDSA